MADFYGSYNSSQARSWHPEPPYRGTYSILSTCLLTIVLCVWTALHLNIPGRRQGTSRRFLRKFTWLLVGLFAPEVVAWTAFRQFRAASGLCRVMQGRFGQRGKSKEKSRSAESHCLTSVGDDGQQEKKRWRWTMAHSHYAIMGGFAVNPWEDGDASTRYASKRFLPNCDDRLTITQKGFEFLALLDPDLIPDISEAEIRDKSNANGLAKAIVCMQAIWFCLQCIVRLCQGLQISLLELNTFSHAVCTILVYALWWDKPLDVEEPTIIQGPETLPATALLCMASKFGRSYDSRRTKNRIVGIRPSFGDRIPTQGDMTGSKEPDYGDVAVLFYGSELHGFHIHDFYIREYGDGASDAADAQAADPRSNPIYISLNHSQVRCMELASQAISRYGVTSWEFCAKDDILHHHTPDRPQFNTDWFGFLLGLSLAGFVYGGLHLSAWNAAFPSPTQQLLWRLSGLTLVASGPLLAIRLAVESIELPRGLQKFFSTCGGCLIVCLPVFAWYSCILLAYALYGAARAYLVIECFVSLPFLPEGVYVIPNWTRYIPHLS